MKHASLFSGIGGFDLAAEWMGWENVFHCEWNEFGQKVLKYYWPKAISYADIKKTDFTIHRGTIDILTGGFPCQPFSVAGKQKGTEDERHLWPEMLRAIREIQSRYVVGENVPGLINWSKGLVFEQVQADLEAAGYEVQSFILPACGTDAPHKRERIWFVAHSDNNRGCAGPGQVQKENGEISKRNNYAEPCNPSISTITNADNIIRGSEPQVGMCPKGSRCEFKGSDKNVNEHPISPGRKEQFAPDFAAKSGLGSRGRYGDVGNWTNFPTQSPVCYGNDGISSRLDGITFPKWRNESIKAGGNAIVHQVVFQIFKAIEAYEQLG